LNLRILSAIGIASILLSGCVSQEAAQSPDAEPVSTPAPENPPHWADSVELCDTALVDTSFAISDGAKEILCGTDGQVPSSPLPSSTQDSNPEICEIKDVSSSRKRFPVESLVVGFPRKFHNIESTGPQKFSVIPVQFYDLKGSNSELISHREQVEKFADYYSKVSAGRLEIEISMADTWFDLPGSQSDYSVSAEEYRSAYGDRIVAMRKKWMMDGVAVADPVMDFTGTQMVIFVLPEGQNALGLTLQAFYGGDLVYEGKSNEGNIRNLMVIGMPETPKHLHWAYYAHEVGHAISLPDWYSSNFDEKPEDNVPIGPMSTFEMMSSGWGPSFTMSAWTRWLSDWLDESQFFCQDYETFEPASFSLLNIDSEEVGRKAVIIRTSDTKAVIVESRRVQDIDEGPTTRSRNGVLVYTIDTSISHGEGALALVLPEGRGLVYPYPDSGGEASLDAVLYLGNSVSIEGLTVSVNETSLDFDLVSISKNQQ
jgi:M6 family metalloprotease-like protein